MPFVSLFRFSERLLFPVVSRRRDDRFCYPALPPPRHRSQPSPSFKVEAQRCRRPRHDPSRCRRPVTDPNRRRR